MARFRSGDSLGSSNLEITNPADEAEAFKIARRQRHLKRLDRREAALAAIERKKKGNVSMPRIKWLERDNESR